MKVVLTFLLFAVGLLGCNAQHNGPTGGVAAEVSDSVKQAKRIITGAERMDVYVPLIRNKRIGIFANQTSMVGNTHLVDTLKKLGLDIRVIFAPEHGFRGNADAGEKVTNYVDDKTGIPVVSLYGSKQKPSQEDMKNIDVLVFDIQDVGVRFYTFISSLQEYMEAAFENSKPLLLLDRPNPNSFYVDGPVLDPKFKSFVGMQPVPIVYGMTISEYAFMIAGEKWLSGKANDKYAFYQTAQNSPDTPFHFLAIKCQNYTHADKYLLPVRPSPNLPEMQSVYLYPSTCLFEGTVLSEGRGTTTPFEVFGHPLLPRDLYAFVPKPNEGARVSKHYFDTCYGWNLHGNNDEVVASVDKHVQLKWLIEAYRLFPGKDSFFTKGFNRLAGNDMLSQQIKEGKTEEEIRSTWEPALSQFRAIRKKYLLYPDSE